MGWNVEAENRQSRAPSFTMAIARVIPTARSQDPFPHPTYIHTHASIYINMYVYWHEMGQDLKESFVDKYKAAETVDSVLSNKQTIWRMLKRF